MSDLDGLCDRGGSFMAARPDYATSRVILIGAPMDFTVSFRPGSRGGPQAIRQVSPGLEEFSIYSKKDLRNIAFHDAGDLSLPFGNVARSLEIIEQAVAGILSDGKFPLLLGGEHLVTLGALRAAARRHNELAIIHLDAHADLRTDYMGEHLSHASVMYQAHRELGAEIYQFGIRSATEEEAAYANQHTHFYPFHVSDPLRACLDKLHGRPVYVSIDIDVVDPAFAPGTGTPEPGGITAAELISAVPLLSGLNVIGLDIVEVAPAYDPAGITALLAAKVIRESLLAFGS